MLVGCRAFGIGGGRGWAPEEDMGNLGSDAGGKLGVAGEGDGDGVLPFRRSRLDPPMWLEWFDPGWLPVADGWDIMPRGKRKRWSSSSLPPSRARLREGGGSMVTAVATHLSAEKHKRQRNCEERHERKVMQTMFYDSSNEEGTGRERG